MGEGLNISNLPQSIQNFIEKHKIDDGNGVLDRTELSNLLSNVANSVVQNSDSFTSRGVSANNPANLAENIRNLADTILKIDEASAEDRAQFDEQIYLAKAFLKGLDNLGEIGKEQVSELIDLIYKNGYGYNEKVAVRYESVLETFMPDYKEKKNAVAESGDNDDPASPLRARANGSREKTLNDIGEEIQAEQKHTEDVIQMNTAIMTDITSRIREKIEDGDISDVKELLRNLIDQTYAFEVDMDNAMKNLIGKANEAKSIMTEAATRLGILGEVLQENISGIEHQIEFINDSAEKDMIQFKEFADFLSIQLEKLDSLSEEDTKKMNHQLYMMHSVLADKVQEFAGRYDNVLGDFEKFDLDNNANLREKANEVAKYKEKATDAFSNKSDHLRMLVTHMVKEFSMGKTVDIQKLTQLVIFHLTDISESNYEAMKQLEAKALEFIGEALSQSKPANSTTGINTLSAKEQLATNYFDLNGRLVENPREGQMYIHNGKKVIYKP